MEAPTHYRLGKHLLLDLVYPLDFFILSSRRPDCNYRKWHLGQNYNQDEIKWEQIIEAYLRY